MDNNTKELIDLIESDKLAIEALLAKAPSEDADENGVFNYASYKAELRETLPLPYGIVAAPFEPRGFLTTNYDPAIHKPESENYTVTLTDDDGEVICVREDGTHAFMHFYKNHSRKYDFVLDSVIKEHLIKEDDVLPYFPAPNNNVMWISGDYDYDRTSPYNDYRGFLDLTLQYFEDVENFYNAYIWVKAHPMAWLHNDEGHYDRLGKQASVWHDVNVRKDRTTYHMLEYGSAVMPDRTERYHDFYLDVYADTFEEAYVQLAMKMLLRFNFDGSERTNLIEIAKDEETDGFLNMLTERAVAATEKLNEEAAGKE